MLCCHCHVRALPSAQGAIPWLSAGPPWSGLLGEPVSSCMQLWDLRNIPFAEIGPHVAEYDEAALKLGDQPELLTGEQCGLMSGLLMLVVGVSGLAWRWFFAFCWGLS